MAIGIYPEGVRTYLRRGLAGLLLAVILLAATGCVAPTQQLGARPAQDPLDAAEAYLQRFQPGQLPRVFQTTRFYDRHGILIAERWDEGRRTWAPLSRISKYLIDATVASEDSTFYSNTGIDPARIVGAAMDNYEAGQVVSGASTITMQLARNLFMGPAERYDQNMDRKMLEGGLAQELNRLFSKDEVLEMYLNLNNYGHLAYGPQAAAETYFGKSVADLTLAEATLIAGIPQYPANLDLFRNFAGGKARQRVVLDLMVRHGYLSQAESDAVHAEPIYLNPEPDTQTNRVPHFVQYVEDVLNARLGQEYVSRSGLNVTTTLDLKMQALAQGIVAAKVKELRPKHDLSNGSLVAMLPYSGEVLVMVGSADFADDAIAGQVNVARSPRQPGSSIKPVLYATALHDNLISPATVLWDVPVSYDIPGSKPYRPVNYDSKFHGPVTVRYALANSYNVPAVKLLNAVSVDRMVRGAEIMGIRSLGRSGRDYGLSLTLGGGEVTLLELTTAYATLASEGRAVAPEPVLSATDAYGRPVLKVRHQAGEPLQAITRAAAFQITDILGDNTARAPMFGQNSALKLTKPAAAKTGTTDDWRDNWTVGYTRYLVAGTWAGNSDGRPMQRISGVVGAAPIWHEFMEGVLKDEEMLDTISASSDDAAWEFSPPPDVELRAECPPGVTCRAGGEYYSLTWLASAGEAGPLADTTVQVASAPVAAPGGGRWTAYCRTEPAVARTLLKLPGVFGLPQAGGPAADAGAPAGQGRASPQEIREVVNWVMRYPAAVDLGPCDQLARVAPGASAGLNAAQDPTAGPAGGALARGGAEPPPDEQVASTQPVVQSSPANYVLNQPIVHHSSCPGHYIYGIVVNQEGAAQPGVQLVLVDEWNNQMQAVSKSGEADLGWYDFPISHFANRFLLTVVDGGGNALSESIVIEHLQGPGGDNPCHEVVLRGL
jgi:penicillin-binding protein 1C